MALRTLRRRVGNAAFSPAELTIAATKHLTFNRVFPGRQGLTTYQMLEAIRSAGHDPLIIETTKGEDAPPPEVQALAFAMPYIESGLPVILALKPPADVGHAVIAIGYHREQPGTEFPTTIVIHNDNTGCYLPLRAQPQAQQDGAPQGYALEQTAALITLLPDGICMTASEGQTLAIAALKFGFALLQEAPPIKALNGQFGEQRGLVLRVVLSTRHSFRQWATKAQDIDEPTRVAYRTLELPKYIWVAEIHDKGLYGCGQEVASRLGEVVLDASADALHGDALIFTRLSGKLMGSASPDDGLLISEKDAQKREIVAIQAPLSLPQSTPWA